MVEIIFTIEFLLELSDPGWGSFGDLEMETEEDRGFCGV